MSKRSNLVRFGQICLLAILWCGVFVQACHAQDSGQDVVNSITGELNGYRIPFTFDPLLQPKIVVRVSINGQPPLPFVVDTGLSTLNGLLIDTRSAEQLHLSPDPQAHTGKIGTTKTWKAHVDSLAFVGAVGTDNVPANGSLTAIVGDLDMLNSIMGNGHVAGIIGIELLASSAVQFDFGVRQMVIYPSSHDTIHIEGASVLPMSQHEGANNYFVNISLQKGLTAELMLDTGADGTAISAISAQMLHPLATASTVQESLYGLTFLPTLLLSSFQLGSDTLTHVEIMTEVSGPIPPVLGIDLLSQFRVTADFPNRLLLLERLPNYTQHTNINGYIGIKSAERGGHHIVQTIDEGSPAQKAGIRPNDTINRIDGHGLAGMSIWTVRRLLSGFANTKAELELQHATGRTYTVSFDRLSAFAQPALPIDGLFLNLSPHKPMEVIGLLPGCVGDKAGLKLGDIILKFNGHSTLGMTHEILIIEYPKAQLDLKVQRKRVSHILSFTLKAPHHRAGSP